MTPQEKAEDLINSFYYSLPNNGSEVGLNSTTERYKEAIQCALIAVDEIIKTIEYSSQADEMSKTSYWEQIKTEIEKL